MTSQETNQNKVFGFHIKYGLPIGFRQGSISSATAAVRARLLREEADEAASAIEHGDTAGDLVNIAKELADVLYVAYGAAVTYDLDLDAIFDLVHRANMTKNGGMADGKLLKGDGYEPPESEIHSYLRSVDRI